MSKKLKLPDSGASATIAIAEELARRFKPKFLADKIEELLTAKMPAKIGKDGKPEAPRINERAVESGIKLIALLQQLADNERRLGGGQPANTETDAEVLKRLAASPSARKAAASFLASFDEKQPKVLEIEAEKVSQTDADDDTIPA